MSDFYFQNVPKSVTVGIKESLILIEKILNIGETILLDLIEKEIIDEYNNKTRILIIISLFKESLERIDGVLILLEKKSTLNANIILRSYLEIYFDLKIILNSTGNKLSYYYIIAKNIERLKKKENLKKELQEKEDIEISLNKEWDDMFELIKNVKELKELVGEDKKSLNKKFKNKWYEVANSNEKYKTQIDKLVYGEFCKEIHGENTITDNFHNLKNIYEIKPLRFPIKYEQLLFIISYYFSHILELLESEFNLDKKYLKTSNEIFEQALKIFENKDKHLDRN